MEKASKAYTIIASTFIVIVGIYIMSFICPNFIANVAHIPWAFNDMTQVCNNFAQNAPHLIETP